MKEITRTLQQVPIDPLTGSISVPIYQTSTFVQERPGVNQGYDYSRSNNPTRHALEKLIAQLENGHAGFAFASGLAAVDAVLKLLNSGDEIIAVDDIYGGTFRLLEHVYSRLGIIVNYVDTTDIHQVEAALTDRTRLVWLESPTNPTLKISDIQGIAHLIEDRECLLIVDNTFASPALQKPLELGADIVLHSATKYLAGHSDVIAGLVVCKEEQNSEKIKFIQNASGGVLGPWDSWLTIRGIETLHLRIERQCNSAFEVARALALHPAVKKVHYPGFRSHPNHEVACRQQKQYGAVISFSLKEDLAEIAEEIVSSTQVFHLAESLGGVKSLLCHPATMTHKSTPRERRLQAGINDSLIRLSVGLEDPQDLIHDLEVVLNKIAQPQLQAAL